MEKAILILGANEGPVKENMRHARKMLQELGEELAISAFYRSEAWGMDAAPSFINQVMILQTHYRAEALLRRCLAIEKALGRVRKEKGGPYLNRTMDIDLLFYGNEVIKGENLEVPHPRLHLRRFVLAPLAELCPEFQHPVLGESINTLLQQCGDMTKVEKL